MKAIFLIITVVLITALNKAIIGLIPVFLLFGAIPAAFAQQQYVNYTDPNSKWSVQYPSHWLVGHSIITRANDSQTINESKFVPFNDANVNIRIAVFSDLSFHPLLQGMVGQWYCYAYFIAGHPTCTAITHNNMAITTTISRNNYLFDLHISNQTEYEEKLPVFMQMLTTFRVN